MIPIQCGDGSRTVLALYDPPASPEARRGVVICSPFAREYFAAYRILRFLARRLSRDGLHVLRFDYYGCGDSGGEFQEGCVESWAGDAETAVAELEAVSGVGSVTLIGVRGGALMASLVAGRSGRIDRLVLWDPVVDPPGFLERAALRSRDAGAVVPSGWPDEGGTAELDGYVYTEEMGRSIRAGSVDPRSWRAVRSLTVVASRASPESFAPLMEEAGAVGVSVDLLHFPWPAPWSGQDDFLAGAVPLDAIQAIGEALR